MAAEAGAAPAEGGAKAAPRGAKAEGGAMAGEGGAKAAKGGADFLVLRGVAAREEIAAICRSVNIPVYVRGLALEEAWEAGATGIDEIGE